MRDLSVKKQLHETFSLMLKKADVHDRMVQTYFNYSLSPSAVGRTLLATLFDERILVNHSQPPLYKGN